MALPLPPIPNVPVGNSHEWRDWFFRLYQNVGGENAGNVWNNIDFTGSNITSIKIREHNTLQGLQGGNDSGTEYYHLSSNEYNGLSNYTNFISTITVTSSPFTYQNATGYNASVIVTGGTVSLVEFSRDGVTFYTIGTTTNTMVFLSPMDFVKVTYSSVPTMVVVPR
jgi:hypothetical protein